MNRYLAPFLMCICLNGISQTPPQTINYQTVVRSNTGAILTNVPVIITFAMHDGAPTGSIIFTETQTTSSNSLGQISVQIGVVHSLSVVNWANGPKYLEIDANINNMGMTPMGTSQLVSVPYALYAETAGKGGNMHGKVNYVVKFTPDSTSGGSSVIYDNGLNVGINTTSPLAALDINPTPGYSPLHVTGLHMGDSSNALLAINPFTGIVDSIHLLHHVGEAFGGGIVFYVYDNGLHGLIAANLDQGTSTAWYNGTNIVTNAVSDGVGAGRVNTDFIRLLQGTGPYAAQLCATYRGGGFGDWYLPSKYELNLMYLNIGLGAMGPNNNIGGFTPQAYWSSTESGGSGVVAWFQNFGDSSQGSADKLDTICVRAVRSF